MSRGKTYSEKLRDPRWQKMRLEVLNRDEWTCQGCLSTTKTLHVHHRYYTRGADPWEYPPEALVTLCEECHEGESSPRRGVEEELLDLLRRRLLVNDLANVFEVFASMPQGILESLARGSARPDYWTDVEGWMRAERERFEEFMRRLWSERELE